MLFLAANPLETDPLKLDEEMRAIDAAIRQGEFRNELDVRSHWAIRVDDLQELLLRYRPDIVHFSGHGSQESKIILTDPWGGPTAVNPDVLSSLFSILRDNVRCVVLNACYSEDQAAGIAAYVDCVIGMTKSVSDEAAVQFSGAFYRAISYGRTVRTAFDLGCNAIRLAGLRDDAVPRLTGAADPGTVCIVKVARDAEMELILDIGSIRPPNAALDCGEIRFSLSNGTRAPIKVTSISLEILRRRASDTIITQFPAGPVDEYFLFASIDDSDASLELLTKHHILGASETDGFLLKLDAPEAHEVDLRLSVTWNQLGEGRRRIASTQPFTIDFPARTPAGLLTLLNLKRRRQVAEDQ